MRLIWSGARFWVQIHGLQLGLMNEKVGTILGEAIGDVNMEWCSFLGLMNEKVGSLGKQLEMLRRK